MTSPIALTDRIAALPDEQAITALALVLQRQGHIIDPLSQDEEQAHIREALNQPEITDQIQPDPTANDGDLARTALTHLADTDPATAGLVEHAMTIAPSTERDPFLILGVGALVLMAFHADIDLQRQPGKGWTFRFRSKPLTDATIGKLLSQLLGNFIHPGQ